jgi:acetamidase/formamidase
MPEHELFPTPANVHWGHFDGALPSIFTIAPGDTITLHSLSGGPEHLPPPMAGMTVSRDHIEVHEQVPRGPGPHIMTGPIAIEGAAPGDALRVEILDIRLRWDWGYNIVRPGWGALPNDTPEERIVHLPIDRVRGIVHTTWGIDIPAEPFFGVMGTAPPRDWGKQTSVVPRAFGGSIDNKMLAAGSILYLPVFEPGGLFSVGDGHAVQGDGEVCTTAVETSLTGVFRIGLIKNAGLVLPRAETTTHHVTMGFDEDLDKAAETALREMIGWIMAGGSLSFEDAYRLCSLIADMRVTQLVNRAKGIHLILPKWTGLIEH